MGKNKELLVFTGAHHEYQNKILAKNNNDEPPPIYLDLVCVVPRNDLQKKFDEKLQTQLEQRLQYQKLAQVVDIKKNSLILDVAVSDYRLGSNWTFATWDLLIPFCWRPKIQLRSRIYNYGSKKVVAKFKIKKYLPWKYFFNRVFSLGISAALSGPKDTQVLLNHAVTEHHDQINKKIITNR